MDALLARRNVNIVPDAAEARLGEEEHRDVAEVVDVQARGRDDGDETSESSDARDKHGGRGR